MNSILKKALEQRERLHFQSALSLLQQIPADQRDEEAMYLEAMLQAGMYHYKKAARLFETLSRSSNPSIQRKASLRLMHLFVQSSRLDEARVLAAKLSQSEGIEEDPEFAMYSSLLRWETGQVSQALMEARKAAALCRPDQGRLCAEAWVMAGDYCSAKSDLKGAEYAYAKALETLDAFPANWRSLRKALIFNNLADAYEQFDLFEEAAAAYQKASEALAECKDEEIFDLDGYRMEILLSQANFYALSDQTEFAMQTIERARARLPFIRMPLHLYWKSRTDYIEGLIRLYSEKPNASPFELLYQAWKEQEQFLSLSPVSSAEYLGKAAYYAAYCYDPAVIEEVSQEDLYLLALELFERYAYKDPHFFRFAIASIENELGNISSSRSEKEDALAWYEKAQAAFADYLKSFPEDEPARISSCAVILNELGLMEPEQLAKSSPTLLEALEHHLQALSSDPEQQPTIQEVLTRLSSIEALTDLSEAKVESIVQSLSRPAA